MSLSARWPAGEKPSLPSATASQLRHDRVWAFNGRAARFTLGAVASAVDSAAAAAAPLMFSGAAA